MFPGFLNNMPDIFGQDMNQKENQTIPDKSEQIYISALALIKMLKHSRSGVPLEVMGLLLGEFVDDYTIKVIDVFAMPQSGTSVSVESVDPVFQQQMLELLKQTQRNEMVVGWYHSHPGFGCWLSGVDVNTQFSFEQLNPKAVAVVIDPIQSVKGKVVIDAFRTINPSNFMLGKEPRQTTSNVGSMTQVSLDAKYKGLDQLYYSIGIKFQSNELENKMLQDLFKHSWEKNLVLNECQKSQDQNIQQINQMIKLSQLYNNQILEEMKYEKQNLIIMNTGKIDPKRHINQLVEEISNKNIKNMLDFNMTMKLF